MITNMYKDLLRLRDELDCLIETYKDLHPEDDIHYDVSGTDVDQEEYDKQTALTRLRENHYEDKFSKSKGKKTPKSGEGQAKRSVRVP